MAVGGLFTYVEVKLSMGQAILKIFSLQNIRQSAHQMSLEPKRRSWHLCFPPSVQNSVIEIFSTENKQKTNQSYLNFPIITVWRFWQSKKKKKTIRETGNQI